MTRETIKEAYGLSEYVDEKIKALEQRAEKAMSDKRCCTPSIASHQLCEDIISREVTLNYIRDNYRRWFINDDAFMQCVNGIKDIAPVTPQQRTGRWVEVIDESDSLGNKTWHHECSICGSDKSGWGTYKHCPDCGAKMEVEE